MIRNKDDKDKGLIKDKDEYLILKRIRLKKKIKK